jgi:hypothetical protein
VTANALLSTSSERNLTAWRLKKQSSVVAWQNCASTSMLLALKFIGSRRLESLFKHVAGKLQESGELVQKQSYFNTAADVIDRDFLMLVGDRLEHVRSRRAPER